MDRQLTLKLASREERVEALRQYVSRLDLTERAVAVLSVLAADGEEIEVDGQRLSRLATSVQRAARLAGCAKGTWLAGVRDLVTLGLMAVVDCTRPRTHVVNWTRLARIPELPADDEAGSGTFAELVADDWSASVRPGQGARDSVSKDVYDVRVDRVRDRVRDSVGGLTGPDQAAGPWESWTSDDLRRAVIHNDLSAIRLLYDEALALGWIDDGLDARLRFLTIVHHCATSAGFTRSRMGGVVARVKRGLDVSRIRHRSEEWARQRLRKRGVGPPIVVGER